MAEIDHPRCRQRVGFHVFSLCEHGDGAPSSWRAWSPSASKESRLALVDHLQVHPAAHRWGNSVINSGEIPGDRRHELYNDIQTIVTTTQPPSEIAA